MKSGESKIPDFIGKMLEKRDKKKNSAKKAEYIGAIIVNLILLYIFNNLLDWNIYFITEAFNNVLLFINVSIIATIIGNALLIIYSPEWFRHLMKIILNVFALIAVYVLYSVFPFSFNSFLIDWCVIISLILVMVGITIATVIEAILLVVRIVNRD